MEIMNSCQPISQKLFDMKEMMKVCTGKMCTRITCTVFLNRFKILFKKRFCNIQLMLLLICRFVICRFVYLLPHKEHPYSGQSRGLDTIKCVYTLLYHHKHIIYLPHPKEMSWLIIGQ